MHHLSLRQKMDFFISNGKMVRKRRRHPKCQWRLCKALRATQTLIGAFAERETHTILLPLQQSQEKTQKVQQRLRLKKVISLAMQLLIMKAN
jgi:hypothetical protein